MDKVQGDVMYAPYSIATSVEGDVLYESEMALLQITTNGKLKTVLAKGAAYESFPWSAFSGRNGFVAQTYL